MMHSVNYKLVSQNEVLKPLCKMNRHYSDTDLAKIDRLSKRLTDSPTVRYRGLLDENDKTFQSRVKAQKEEVEVSQEKETSCCDKLCNLFFSSMMNESNYGPSYPPGLYWYIGTNEA